MKRPMVMETTVGNLINLFSTIHLNTASLHIQVLWFEDILSVGLDSVKVELLNTHTKKVNKQFTYHWIILTIKM